jgi:hypothetical protein
MTWWYWRLPNRTRCQIREEYDVLPQTVSTIPVSISSTRRLWSGRPGAGGRGYRNARSYHFAHEYGRCSHRYLYAHAATDDHYHASSYTHTHAYAGHPPRLRQRRTHHRCVRVASIPISISTMATAGKWSGCLIVHPLCLISHPTTNGCWIWGKATISGCDLRRLLRGSGSYGPKGYAAVSLTMI